MMTLCVMSLGVISSADTLILRDGTRLDGTVTGIAARTITFRHADGKSRRYPTSEVEALLFVSAERANPHAVNDRTLEAPSGTRLVVKTVETIDSRNAGANQLFSAIIEQAVMTASGRVIVPEGSSVQLMIRQIAPGEASAGPEMLLDVQSITIKGKRYVVSPSDLALKNTAGIDKTTRTDEVVGAGAAIGTIIGTGAIGGDDGQVTTRGRDVQVSADTVLVFRLDRAVMLRAEAEQ
jgi:hypothetical protein